MSEAHASDGKFRGQRGTKMGSLLERMRLSGKCIKRVFCPHPEFVCHSRKYPLVACRLSFKTIFNLTMYNKILFYVGGAERQIRVIRGL